LKKITQSLLKSLIFMTRSNLKLFIVSFIFA